MVGEYLDDKKDEGSHDSEGFFTLDPNAAKDKLGRYLLPNPSYRLLKFIQAAVVAECEAIELKISRKKLSLVARKWKADFPIQEIVEDNLAQLSERPTEINLHWAGPQTDVTIDFSIKGSVTTSHDLRETVQQHCWPCPIPISLNAKRVDQDGFADDGYRPTWNAYLPPETLLAETSLSGVCGRVALRVGLKRRAQIYFVQSGVLIDCREVLSPVPGVAALIQADHLQADLSGFHIAENEAYHEVLTEVEQTAQHLRLEVLDKLEDLEAQFAPFSLTGKIRWKKRVSGTALGIVGGAAALLGLTGDVVLGTFLIGSPLLVCATVASASLTKAEVFEPDHACHEDLREQIRARLNLQSGESKEPTQE